MGGGGGGILLKSEVQAAHEKFSLSARVGVGGGGL